MAKKPVPITRRQAGTSPDWQLRTRSVPGAVPAAVPLIHVCAVGTAREIVKSRQLEARYCKVFKRDLLYFFALKPAYGLKEGDAKSHQINRFPFAFVVRPEAVPHPYHVYPLDTGGALHGVFKVADPYVPLEDYELDRTHAAVTGHIRWAFDDIDAYFAGDLRSGILDGVPVHETVTRGYVDIARSPAAGGNQPDARASAIEVACSHHVELKGNVELAIIPRQYMEGEDGKTPNTDMIGRLDAEKIPWEPYEWQPNAAPDEFRDEITRIVKAHYDAKSTGASLK